MAEVVGLVASAFTLGEVAIKVIKLKKIYSDIRNVPTYIKKQLDELEVLSAIITEIEAEAEIDGLQGTTFGAMTLRYCKSATDELDELLQDLDKALQSPRRLRRTATKVKVALDQESLVKAGKHLDSARQSLQLAMTLKTYSLTKKIPERMASMYLVQRADVANPVTSSSLENQVTPSLMNEESFNLVSMPDFRDLRWSTRSYFGNITTSKRYQTVQERSGEIRKVQVSQARIRLPSWLSRTVWDILAYESSGAMMWKISTWNVRPRSSEIFKAARSGDLNTINSLILSGKASLYDRDEYGFTLLHYAILYGYVVTATSLMKMGHPVREQDTSGCLPFDFFYRTTSLANSEVSEVSEFVALMISSGDFSDEFQLLPSLGSNLARGTFWITVLKTVVWSIPGAMKLMINEMSGDFRQLPLARQFESFSWYVVEFDTLDDILFENQWSIDGLRSMMDDSRPDQSLHSFVEIYFTQYRDNSGTQKHNTIHTGRINDFTQRFLSGISVNTLTQRREYIHTTPLLNAIADKVKSLHGRTRSRAWERNLTIPIHNFLEDVSRAGINLVEYGRKELSLLMSTESARSVRYAFTDYNSRWSTIGPYLVSMKYGPNPEDWEYIWDYMVEEFAGDFWEMVDNPPLAIPGGWVD
ncbi:hypothetical protein QQS21_005393 [Conoideocrella luteorostrata]|uniref:Uncharacterized protein n=1 Tax=Conoideocrella luteorostrata TaxID=1105319 RepID=A0AAJ0CPT5_9HYPO|nr:hypothetical protein QQS21_005393 [Conoideocrella luteorostrata]